MSLETDIAIILQKKHKVSIRLDLYNSLNVKIGELTGHVLSVSGSTTAESDIRRVLNVNIHILDSSFVTDGSTIWLDKKIKAYVGLTNAAGAVVWYIIGTYLIGDTSFTYSATAKDLSIPLVDLMAGTTEKRGSQIGGYGLKILAGENIRSAIIGVIESFTSFTSYNIPEFSDTIPYDLEFSIGVYPYEVLKTILSLYPTYEMFSDANGVFTVAEIPTGIGDSVFLDESVIDALIFPDGETDSSDFSSVRNTTEVIGRSLKADYTASTCTTSGNTYNLFIDDLFEVLEDGALYGFTPDANSVSGQKVKIQSTNQYGLYLQGTTQASDIPIASGAMTAGIPYCIKYTQNRFYLQGELEIRAIVQEVRTALSLAAKAQYKLDNDCRDVKWVVNPSSPFAADFIGEKRRVLSDGEYADIYTTALALERGAYENWTTTRLPDSINLNMLYIPWLPVNVKISRTNPITHVVETFMVKSISFDLASYKMTVSATTYYPYYPFME